MKQKKLVLTVYSADGNVQFSKDPATPDEVIASLHLFTAVGNEIRVSVGELDIISAHGDNVS